MALDTGNSFLFTTHKDVLERVGLWKIGVEPEIHVACRVASGAVTSFSVQMPSVKIFGIPVDSSVWDVIDLPSSSAEGDGTVGFGFLKNFNIVIDYERRRVWFENWTSKVTDEPEGETGISAVYSNRQKASAGGRWVSPDSPADQSGVKEGDLLLSVDGRPWAGDVPPIAQNIAGAGGFEGETRDQSWRFAQAGRSRAKALGKRSGDRLGNLPTDGSVPRASRADGVCCSSLWRAGHDELDLRA